MKRILAIAVVLAASPAGAVPFPADSAYVPLHCGGQVMTDAYADDPSFLAERDLVGNDTAPTGLRASNAQYLFLRIRLDQDPAPGGSVKPSSWGMEFDLDGDRTTYELLVLAEGINGAAGSVSVFTNNTTTVANDPTDPADLPPAKTYTFAAAARSISTSTTNGGNPDYFLDIAVPWADLIPLGLDHDTKTYVWAASSSQTNSLDGDFACNDTGSGPPRLDSSASDATTGDPARDPSANGSLRLEGGGGCSAGGGAGWLALALVLMSGVPARKLTRRSTRARSPARSASGSGTTLTGSFAATICPPPH